MYQSITLTSMLLSASTTTASMFVKRDSWGPALGLGPAKQQIIKTTTTIYPGKMPSNQPGYLFTWLGISNGTGDLIQSIIGSYPKDESQCSGPDADTTWCVSSEVYGLAPDGHLNQWVGDLKTADPNYANGIKLTYTLADKATHLWTQTMEDAVTGKLLSSYNKTSGPMLGWGTALECHDFNGASCKGSVEQQSYINSTIILEAADKTFVRTLGSGKGVTHSDMVTADGGKTWTIAKILIPAMTSEESTSSSGGSTAAADSNDNNNNNDNNAASASSPSPELKTAAPVIPPASNSPSSKSVSVPTIPTLSSSITSRPSSSGSTTKSSVTKVSSTTAKASACSNTGVPIPTSSLHTSFTRKASSSKSTKSKSKKPKKTKSSRATRPTAL